MNKIDILYQKWQSLQPLPERKQYLLSQRFTVDYNYNSNHIEGNTLTYGQTELLLLFGKVSGEGDLKDFNDMKASQVSLKMIEEEAKNLNMPLTETFIRQLHKHYFARTMKYITNYQVEYKQAILFMQDDTRPDQTV